MKTGWCAKEEVSSGLLQRRLGMRHQLSLDVCLLRHFDAKNILMYM